MYLYVANEVESGDRTEGSEALSWAKKTGDLEEAKNSKAGFFSSLKSSWPGSSFFAGNAPGTSWTGNPKARPPTKEPEACF